MYSLLMRIVLVKEYGQLKTHYPFASIMFSLFRAIGNRPLMRMSSFAALGVHPQLVSRLQSLNITTPSSIQEKVLSPEGIQP